jgi:hypothetical protein
MTPANRYRRDGDILAALPSVFARYADLPGDMVGATIIRMGTIPDLEVEGGGLVIDYKPRGSRCAKRVVFGFNDVALWIESEEPSAP